MAATGKAPHGRIGLVIDYLFGRNALIGVASFMLLAISGYATWSGMSDFILGAQTAPDGAATRGRELAGLSVSGEWLVVAITVALTFLMWLALRETFGARRRIQERMITFPLYLFLFLWSVGFGYGFWWSLIAGEEATRTSLAGLQEDARDAGEAIAARLDAVRAQLDNVVAWSDGQMTREEASGGSCGVSSGAGRGPLYNARRSVRDSVATLRDGIDRNWLGPVRTELANLSINPEALALDTLEDRRRAFESLAADTRGRARALAARSNALGQSTAAEMRALAESVSTPPGQLGFSCFDPTLAQRLRQAAEQAEEPALLALRDASFTEGAAGVANAVKSLWAWIGGGLASLAPGVFGGTEQPTTGFEGRDLIALLATLGVDLGLFALTVLNPPTAAPARRDSLDDAVAQLYEPSATSIRELSSAIRTALQLAPEGANLDWVRRHFVNHLGYSYFVVPNLANCTSTGMEGRRALAINQLAGVFTKLNLIQAVDRPRRGVARRVARAIGAFKSELRFREGLGVVSVLVGSARDGRPIDVAPRATEKPVTEGDTEIEDAGRKPAVRLAGNEFLYRPTFRFFSSEKRRYRDDFMKKAERALEIAGWSGDALKNPEIFFLYYREGIEPLLTVLEAGEAAKIPHDPPAQESASEDAKAGARALPAPPSA